MTHHDDAILITGADRGPGFATASPRSRSGAAVVVCRTGPRMARRPSAVTPCRRHARDLEDLVAAWLAQQMAKTPIAGLLRIGWDTVGRIVERVVTEHLDERRLAGLVAVGVDEISWRRGHRYLTTVVDHRGRDRVVRRRPQRPDLAGLLR